MWAALHDIEMSLMKQCKFGPPDFLDIDTPCVFYGFFHCMVIHDKTASDVLDQRTMFLNPIFS
jgi:hypothetical protein